MSLPIVIRWNNAQEPDFRQKQNLFENIVNRLRINIVNKQGDFKIASIEVNKQMIKRELCMIDTNQYEWNLEMDLDISQNYFDWLSRWLNQQGLKQFLQFLYSGYLKTDQARIWMHLLLACLFRSDQFLRQLMKLRINIRDQSILQLLLTSHLQYLPTVKSPSTNSDFLSWLIVNNPAQFSIRNLSNCSIGTLAIILEAKGRANTFSFEDIQSLQQVLSQKYPEEAEYRKVLFQVVPWESSVSVVEVFRNQLGNEECLRKLKRISEKIAEREREIGRKKEQLGRDVSGVKTMCEKLEQELYVKKLGNIIEEENLNYPGRYEGVQVRKGGNNGYQGQQGGGYQQNLPPYNPNSQPNPSIKKPQPPKISPQQQADRRFAMQIQNPPQSKPQPRPPPASSSAMQTQQQQLQRAIALSLNQHQPPPKSQPPKPQFQAPPAPAPAPSSNQPNVHDSNSCNSRQRLQFDCGHTLCMTCVIGRYINRTEAFEDLGRPLSYEKAASKRVDCWICRKILTSRDVQAINSRIK